MGQIKKATGSNYLWLIYLSIVYFLLKKPELGDLYVKSLRSFFAFFKIKGYFLAF